MKQGNIAHALILVFLKIHSLRIIYLAIWLNSLLKHLNSYFFWGGGCCVAMAAEKESGGWRQVGEQ